MTRFNVTILKFGKQGEKTGWTYFVIPAAVANKINPGIKTGYRVKGKLDEHPISKVAVLPMGEGDLIMPLNAAMRKATGKRQGDKMVVQLEVDKAPIKPPAALIACLEDEPEALKYYHSLPQGHRNYYTKWIQSAKTEPTKTRRIALVVNTLSKKMDFGEMLRMDREERKKMEG